MADYVTYGRRTAAGRGGAWIAQGWSIFAKQPGLWIAMFVVVVVVALVLRGLLGGIGIALLLFLAPAVTASLSIACRKLDREERVKFSVLLEGFRTRFGPLAVAGAAFAAIGVVLVVGVGKLMGVGMLPPDVLLALAGQARAGMLDALNTLTSYLVATLLILALMIPVLMAIWFAPLLIVFHDKSAPQALRESFVACLRNVAPFLWYGVLTLPLAVLATIPLFLGWLVLGPVLAASVYTGYKDIFTAS